MPFYLLQRAQKIYCVKKFFYPDSFPLENGAVLPAVEIAYHTYGTLNAQKNNVVWVFHALTANSDCCDWWSGIIGDGKVFDPANYFIVCANILGSCYGTSGPLCINPETGEKYFSAFPQVTIRDMVRAHDLLRRHLGITRIYIAAGGSMGAYQALEWVVMEPSIFDKLLLTTTSPRESAWGISIHTAQRIAIEADATWKECFEGAGAKGLKAARAIGMLTYRSYEAFTRLQTDPDENKLDNFKAESYIQHQGNKLVKRFNAYSYWLLTKAMDSHNIARGRGKLEGLLETIQQKTLIVGISSDFLCPTNEQKFMAAHMPHAVYREIDSIFGHDGFLVEFEKLDQLVRSELVNPGLH
jgi:homoserine O-acetyltransferase/O-succinyltransferase